MDDQKEQTLETDTLYAVATEVRILVSILTQASQQALKRRLSQHNPRIGGFQYGILCALSFEEQTIAELSRKFMRSPSTFVPAVDALERKGLLRRSQDPDDRRRMPLSVTESGRKLLADVSFVESGDPLIQGLEAVGKQPAVQLLSLLHELAVRLPNGHEIGQHVKAKMRMHAQCSVKEVL